MAKLTKFLYSLCYNVAVLAFAFIYKKMFTTLDVSQKAEKQ